MATAERHEIILDVKTLGREGIGELSDRAKAANTALRDTAAASKAAAAEVLRAGEAAKKAADAFASLQSSAAAELNVLTKVEASLATLATRHAALTAATGSSITAFELLSGEFAESTAAAQRYGVAVPKAVSDIAGRMADLGAASKVATAEVAAVAPATAKVAVEAVKTGTSAASLGPIFRTAGNVGADAMKQLAGSTLQLTGALGPLGALASSITFKAVEDGVENTAEAMAKGQGPLTAMKTGLAGLAASPVVAGAALAGLGIALYKLTTSLTDATNELGSFSAAAKAMAGLGVDTALEKTTDAGKRQGEQMKQLADALGTTVAELSKFKTGSGAEGFDAIVEHAKADPEGRIGKAFLAMGSGAREAHKAGLEVSSLISGDMATYDGVAKALDEIPKRWDALRDSVGSSSAAFALMGDDVAKTAEQAKKLGLLTPEFAGFAAAIKEIGTLGAEAKAKGTPWDEESQARLDKFRAKEQSVVDASRAAMTALAASHEAAKEQAAKTMAEWVVTMQETSDQLKAIKMSYDIGGGGSSPFDAVEPQTAKVEGEDLQKLLDMLNPENLSGGAPLAGNLVEFLKSFATNVKSGDLNALEEIIKAVTANAQAYLSIPESRHLAAPYTQLAQHLQNVLRELRSAAGMAGGGPVTMGTTVLTGEEGPELFVGESGVAVLGAQGPQYFKPWESGEIIPADTTEAIVSSFGGRPSASGGFEFTAGGGGGGGGNQYNSALWDRLGGQGILPGEHLGPAGGGGGGYEPQWGTGGDNATNWDYGGGGFARGGSIGMGMSAGKAGRILAGAGGGGMVTQMALGALVRAMAKSKQGITVSMDSRRLGYTVARRVERGETRLPV